MKNIKTYNDFLNESVSGLFPWYVDTLTKHNLDDDIELFTAVLMKARRDNLNKNQVYNILISKDVNMTPEATDEIFSKFDELVQDSYSL